MTLSPCSRNTHRASGASFALRFWSSSCERFLAALCGVPFGLRGLFSRSSHACQSRNSSAREWMVRPLGTSRKSRASIHSAGLQGPFAGTSGSVTVCCCPFSLPRAPSFRSLRVIRALPGGSLRAIRCPFSRGAGSGGTLSLFGLGQGN